MLNCYSSVNKDYFQKQKSKMWKKRNTKSTGHFLNSSVSSCIISSDKRNKRLINQSRLLTIEQYLST